MALLERVCANLFDSEILAATCTALERLRMTDQAVVQGMPAEVAGALCWVVGRANGCIGAGTPVTQQVLKRELGLKGGSHSPGH